jgi:hypothetical protein
MRKEDLPRLASELSQILAYPGPLKKGWRKWRVMKPPAARRRTRRRLS